MLITLENVGKSYGIDVIIQGVTTTINEQDRIGIIGENGAGKTTLLSMLMGVIENDDGNILFADNVTVGYLKQIDGLNADNTIYSEMETVFDEVFKATKRMKEIEEILIIKPDDTILIDEHHNLQNLIHSKDGYNIDFHIKKMLNGMGFTSNEWEKQVGVLSGGERTRLNLAKLLLENPDILVLDEPTNHLDFDTLVWLEDYLLSYNGCIIAVSHDRFFLDKITNRIFEVEDTYLYEYKGNYSAFEVQKEEKLKLQQKQYEADLEKAAKLQDYIDRNLVRASTTKMAQSRRKTLEKMEITEKPRNLRVPLKFSFEFDTNPYDEILKVENLAVSVATKDLISNLNIDIRRGDRLIIAGANGTGKTTLINTLMGKIRPREGKIKFGSGAKPIVYDQHINVHGGTVIDNIWAYRPKWVQYDVRSYLAKFGYRNDDVFKECDSLSGGEKARLRFCQISLERANLLFMDEPTNHLDIYMRQAVTDALSRYEGTIIVITHDRFLMQQLDCSILNIENKTGVIYKDFDDFVNKRSTDSFISKSNNKKEEKINSAISQKEQRRQVAQDRLKLKECERDIEKYQGIIEDCETKMLDSEITTNPDKMAQLWQDMEQAKNKSEELFEVWAELSEKLESL